jgi:biopolymer transport protein ExbD
MRLAPVRGRGKPEVQIAPLIDVVFLLLIFYAVTTQFVSDERLKLKLPEAKTAEQSGQGAEERPPVIKVSSDGTVFINDEPVPEAQLEPRIRGLVDQSPEKSVILMGDRESDYGVVVHVLDICRSVGATTIQMSAEKPSAE